MSLLKQDTTQCISCKRIVKIPNKPHI